MFKLNKNNKSLKILLTSLMLMAPLTVNAKENWEPGFEPEVENTLQEVEGVELSEFEEVEVEMDTYEGEEVEPRMSTFAAPAGGPYFGDFWNQVGFNDPGGKTVEIFLSSKSTSKYSYTHNSAGETGVFPILDQANGRYKIMLSGLVGWVDAKYVTLTAFNSAKSYNYYVLQSNGEIWHYISKGARQDAASIINQGIAPASVRSKLSPGTKYLSFDGHYFYQASLSGMNNMISDYNKLDNLNNDISSTHQNSVNRGVPFYNYFQWLPVRTQSKLTTTDMRNYLGYTSASGSRLYETEEFFIQNGNIYGGNSALGFATAIHESGYGRSSFSKERNNYFGHNAVDSFPGLATAYPSPRTGISVHYAKFYNQLYLNRNYGYYYGSFVGNKDMGMNVMYASDPYWGEKIAAHYYNMDKKAGFKDFGRYTIGMVNTSGATFRKDASTSAAVSDSAKYSGIPIAIVNEKSGTSVSGSTKWYGFTSDSVLNSNKDRQPIDANNMFTTRYNLSDATLYIHSSLVNIIYSGDDSVILPTTEKGMFNDPTISSTKTVVYTLENVNLRPDWSTRYSSILSIPQNTRLDGYITTNGWIQVVYNGHVGFISANYASKTSGGSPIGGQSNPPADYADPNPPSAGSTKMIVNKSSYMRTSVGQEFKNIATLPVCAEVQIGKEVRGMVHVKYGNSQGYAPAIYFSTPGSVSCSSRKLGDINGDGKIDAIDMAMMQSHVRGIKTLTGEEFKAADINKDGKIDAIDMAMIQSHVRGIRKIEGW